MLDPKFAHLVEQYVPMAQAIAVQIWKTAPFALDVDELKGIAYLALTESVNRWPSYCAERGYDETQTQFFRVFSSHRIRGAIYDNFRKTDWATRSLRTRNKQLQKAGQATGATMEELSERSGLTMSEVRDTIVDMSRKPVSLEDGNLDQEAPSSVEDEAATNSLLAVFAAAVKALPVEHKIVLVLRYYSDLKLREIAEVLEFPSEYVSQLHTEAITAVHEELVSAAGDRQVT